MDISLTGRRSTASRLGRLLGKEAWAPVHGPLPASYWLTATMGALVVLFCYASAWWVPSIVADYGYRGAGPFLIGLGPVLVTLFGLGVGALTAAAPFLALRWPGVAIVLALAPGAFCLLYGAPVPFGLFAALGAVTLTASWRRPVASVVAVALAALIVWAWIATGDRMVAPLRTDISIDYYDTARRVELGVIYTVVLLLVLAAAAWMRVAGVREGERRALAARSGEVEDHAAVVAERARLSRDLHDVVAHHVSLIAVRAETAPYTSPDLQPEARAVLADIAADARLALDELRGVLGILGRAAGEPDRAPQPTWADIGALVERTRTAGVDITVQGDLGVTVGAASGYAAYRVVQEALTNARRHASGMPVAVHLESTGALLVVRVSTSGRTGVRPDVETRGSGAGSAQGVGTGQGLVGMRERVEALGGRLVAAPRDGGFVVEATLPRGVA
ncbi:sensor histidine kinase [Nocardioides terrisoli]|uniref:sensor histidine kinase n=1 Tax=Nocardioides terrisoli TaxID=3388267 RepID=UPI00287BA45E|nr:histidine kinase [Nocardioides marmorisolisilvae]